MSWGRRKPDPGNYPPCRNCGVPTYWRDGPYCVTCATIPERRCLDCGEATRAGKIEYEWPQAAEWGEMSDPPAEAPDRPRWQPRPMKERKHDYRSLHPYVVPGPCLSCGSTNLARLEFGIDRLPADQRTCSAWPKVYAAPDSTPTRVLKQSLDDPRITWKTCVSCGGRLYERFGPGASEAWRYSPDGHHRAAREARVPLPDGRWTYDYARLVHQLCPDPEAVAA